MHKNSNQYQSTPSLKQNYQNGGYEQQGYSYQYGNPQQEQYKNEQRVPQKSNIPPFNKQISQQKNNFHTPISNQQGLIQGNNPYYQQETQYDDQDEQAQDMSGQNQNLNHTFSEDSNTENSQVMYPSENKENSIINQRQDRQQGICNEGQRGINNNLNKYGNLNEPYGQQLNQGQIPVNQENSKKKRTLAIITLDVGGGNSDVIKVMEGDDLSILAKNFCSKHNLDDDCIQYIIRSIQTQLDKRKARKKDKTTEVSNNQSQQSDNSQSKPSLHQNVPSKDNNFRKSSDSPKFPGLQQSQQGSLQNNYNLHQQAIKQNVPTKQMHFNPQQSIEEENSRKKRPQQPSFGQNQFFEQVSPQKARPVYEQINEEDYEDQSISVVGQSANITMPDENYEYQSTNRYQTKSQSKNQIGSQNQIFDKDTIPIGAKNNFLSPPQNNKIGAQQFSSPQNTGCQQLANNNSNVSKQNMRSPENQAIGKTSILAGQKNTLNNNSSGNSNMYNYQQDQEEFLDGIEDHQQTNQHLIENQLLFDRQDILDYDEFNPKKYSNNMQFGENANSQNPLNAANIANFNQNQRSKAQPINFMNQKQQQQNQIGNQLYPSQKPAQFNQQNYTKEQRIQSNDKSELDNYKILEQQIENNVEEEQHQEQYEDNPQDKKEQRKKVIEQIQQKLNIESKKHLGMPSSTQQKMRQPSDSSQPSQSHSKQLSKGKGNNLQSQLEAKKEQFFNSYYSQRQHTVPNQRDQEDVDDIDNYFEQEQPNKITSSPTINKNKQTQQNKEQQFESPQRHLRKSYSNNNLQNYVASHNNEQIEEKSSAQQSYEQWQKLLSQKAVGQKVNLKVKRVSGNTPTTSTNPIQGKVYQIQNNQPSTPSNQKKSQVFNNQNIGSNSSISPRTINKNKSATQLNNIATNQSMVNVHQNFHQQAFSQSQLTPHKKLYLLGLEQMERRQRNFEENQEKSKERQIQGSTFRPSISPQSRNMKLQEGVKLEDYLILEGRKNKERKAIAALIKDEENNQECKFKPQVSVVSQKLAEHQQSHTDSNFSSIHDRLYQQGLSDIASKEEWSNQQFYTIYPFNPDLGVNKDRQIPEKTQKDFTNRLISEKQVKEAKILAQRQKQNDFVDKQTGQKLFHPKINKDEVHYNVSQRVDLQDKLLEEELKSSSTSPMNSMNLKKGREVQPPRIGQLKWDDMLRSNRQPDHYTPKSQIDTKGRSVTPRNMKTVGGEFEETNYIPLSSRGNTSQISANMEIENILNQSSFRNKRVVIKPSKSKDKLQTIPVINLSRKNISTTPTNFHSSQVNQTKLSKNASAVNYNQTVMNQTNFSTATRSKAQLNQNGNQTQLELSAISQFDNGKVFNDHKLSDKIAILFDQFDSDQDGKINAINIDISTTEPEILEIVQNVLFEIDGKNLTLNRNQFTQLLCTQGLIVPLKRYFSEKEGEVCDEDMTDYDLIRSNISAINFQNHSYMESNHYNTTNILNNNPAYQRQQQQQSYESYNENQQQQQLPNDLQNTYDTQFQHSNIGQSNQIKNSKNNATTNIYSNSITDHIINNSHMINNNRNLNLSKKPSKHY